MPTEEQMDDAARRVHATIQTCISDGLLAEGMVVDWYLTGTYIGEDGAPGSIFLSPVESTAPGSLGMVNVARIVLEEEVRAWAMGEDDG